MGIDSIKVTGEYAQNLGLREATMSRLGRVVALAGANGGGKSRLLRYIEQVGGRAHEQAPSAALNKGHLESFRILIDPSNSGSPQYQSHLAGFQHYSSVLDCVDLVEWDGDSSPVVRFSPKAGELQDPAVLTDDQRTALASGLSRAHNDAWPGAALSYIQELQDNWHEATHQNRDTSTTQEDLDADISRYLGLRADIEKLLKAQLLRSRQRATMFGRPLGSAEFSQGQRMMLQLATAMHARGAKFGGAVLVLDEPETHLHPRAVVEVLKALMELAPDCQIWLATHSIPLLAYVSSLEDASIWAVDDGHATYSGRKPETVIQALLGTEDDLAMLSSFASLPYHLASNTYAYQCMFPPGVSDHANGDDQLAQIRNILTSTPGTEKRAIRILDFGAGKGRLLSSIQLEQSNGAQIEVDYYAFDEYPDNRDICQSVINATHDASEERYFIDRERLKEKLRGTIDVVVMTNVLHEIEPAEWLSLFGSGGLIAALLNERGHLLIVEDQRIPVGERAHKYGFLLLDANELRTLFGVTAADEPRFWSMDARGDSRLKAHVVSRSLMPNVTAETRMQAIQELRNKALDQLARLRRSDQVSYANGMLNGLWTQLVANADLYIRESSGR